MKIEQDRQYLPTLAGMTCTILIVVIVALFGLQKTIALFEQEEFQVAFTEIESAFSD